MNRLSRIQIGNQILVELYEVYKDLSDEELSDFFYSFLAVDTNNDALTKTACFNYQAEAEELIIRKKDIILEILASSYGYLRYVSTFCEIPDLEKQVLKDLDELSFSIPTFINYFRSPENETKIKRLLINYFIYKSQEQEFAKECQDYLSHDSTEFYERICRLIGYVEVMDILSIIHEDVLKKYESGEYDEYELFEEDEEYEDGQEEEYGGNLLELDADSEDYEEGEDSYENLIQTRIFELEEQEVYDATLSFLEDYYKDKFATDDFIGYFMSYVYAFLLKEKQEGAMSLEDEELLKILSRKNISFEHITELFYASKDFTFNAIDLFTQEYYGNKGDIFSTREKFASRFNNDLFNLLDPYYEGPDLDYKVIYIGSPANEKFSEMLIDIKNRNKDDYIDEIWNLLQNPTYDDSIFADYGFDLEHIEFYKVLMMRFLARKYVAALSFEPISSFSLEELYIYQGLMHMPATTENIKTLFKKGHYFIIPAYYEMLEKGIPHEKRVVRKLRSNNLLGNLTRLDSSCATDMIYRKALQESEFYSILEANGEKTTISYLKHLFKVEPETAMGHLKELLASNYYYSKEENLKDAISLTIINLIEEDADISSYLYQLIQQDSLLEELLQRYLAQETKTKYPLSYQEKLELSPKIKQKLYPKDM